jgi:hypothetical protein
MKYMKLNKTSLITAGAIIASLSFCAGTITTPAGASMGPSAKKWFITYSSVMKSYQSDIKAVGASNNASIVNVCGKFQNLGLKLAHAPSPGDKTLNTLANKALGTVLKTSTDCLWAGESRLLGVAATNGSATKLFNDFNYFDGLYTRIFARVKQLTN